MQTYLLHLSIIIVTYKGDNLLKQCLDSLVKACGSEPEIVVVDNSKSDATEDIVKAYANTKYIASETNLGFAGGNNLGLPFCTREYVLLLNNDTIIYQDSFSPVIDYMEKNPKVAVAGGTMRLAKQGDVLDECGIFISRLNGCLIPPSLYAPSDIKLKAGPVFAIKGAFLIFKKAILDELDGILFYDHFKSYYEDIDFCHRVWLAGYEVHFVPTPYIDHLQSQTAKRINDYIIGAQMFANCDFSLRVNLRSIYCRLYIGHRIFLTIIKMITWLNGNKTLHKQICGYKKINKARKNEMLSGRKQIQKTRKISDSDLLIKVGINPPLRYYYYTLKGVLNKAQECIRR